VSLLVLAVIPLLTTHPVIIHILIYCLFFAYFGLAWSIVGVLAGQLSLGHAIFFGVGAYASSILLIQFQLSPWVGMLIGASLAAAIAALLGFPCFRLRGAAFALATLAFAEILRLVAEYWIPLTGGPGGLVIPLTDDSLLYFQFLSKVPYYYIMLSLLLMMTLSAHTILRSKFGFYLAAISDDEDAARSIGINVFQCKLKAATISAFFTGILGTFYAQYTRYIDPVGVFGLWRSCDPIIIAIVGGPGVLGPILGSFILTPVAEGLIITLGGSYATIKMMMYGLLITIVVLWLRQGVVGRVRGTCLSLYVDRDAASRN
jgi:branched-chain amino acid transport system permease protein